jgi:hypothetical protein
MRFLALALFLLLTGCAVVPAGWPDDARKQAVYTAAPPDEAYVAAVHAASKQGWQVHSTDRAGRVFTARTDGLRPPIGEDVTVYVTPLGSGARVTIRSRVATEPHRRKVDEYLGRLAAVLGR